MLLVGSLLHHTIISMLVLLLLRFLSLRICDVLPHSDNLCVMYKPVTLSLLLLPLPPLLHLLLSQVFRVDP